MVKVSPVRYFLPASCLFSQSNFFLRFVQRVVLHGLSSAVGFHSGEKVLCTSLVM